MVIKVTTSFHKANSARDKAALGFHQADMQFNLKILYFMIRPTATIFFAASFCVVLLEGGVYFFGKPGNINEGWIRYT